MPRGTLQLNSQIVRHRTLQPSDGGYVTSGRRGSFTPTGRSPHNDSCRPVWWPRQIPQRAKRGHLVHGAVGEYHRCELRRFKSDQTELDRKSRLVAIFLPPTPSPAFASRRSADGWTARPFHGLLGGSSSAQLAARCLIALGDFDEAGQCGSISLPHYSKLSHQVRNEMR